MGAGSASYQDMLALLEGNPAPLVIFVCLLVYCMVLGIAGGFLLHRRHERASEAAGESQGTQSPLGKAADASGC